MIKKEIHVLRRRWGRALQKIRDRVDGLPPITRTALTHDRIAALIDRSAPTILEIGCNDGSDTAQLLEVMPNARMFCFEPDERPLEKFAARFANDPRVHLSRMALGNASGEIEFYRSSGSQGGAEGDWDKSGSIRPPKNHLVHHPWVTFEGSYRVPVQRLDEWCLDNAVEAIDFIWMDVQGAEGDVIAGGPIALGRTRYLYTEYSDSELYAGQPTLRALIAMLPQFELLERYRGDVLFRHRDLK